MVTSEAHEVDLSIIIVSWNVEDLLRDCLNSLAQYVQKYTYEVWVIDNNSQDGTVDMVRAEFPDVGVIANEANVGFARANNQGLAQSKGKFIVALNPDTYLMNDALDQLADFLSDHPDYGAAGPMLILGNDQPQAECARYNPTLGDDLQVILGRRSQIKHYDFYQEADVEAISGACMMLPRGFVADQGFLFSEDYFMYGEDLELCRSVWQAAQKIRYLPQAKVRHLQGSSAKKAHNVNVESALAMYQYRKKVSGLPAALLTRFFALLMGVSRLPKGIWLRLSGHSNGEKYLAEHIEIIRWVFGLSRNVGQSR